ncbi:unnamed protein product, partial [Coccothraustes coccothraustes]
SGTWGQEQDSNTQHFVSIASLCCKSRVASVRLKCGAVSEETLFIAVAPCRASGRQFSLCCSMPRLFVPHSCG